MDTKHIEKTFSNELESVGHEFGEHQAKKEKFIEENKGKYMIRPYVPKNIKGLTPKVPGSRIPEALGWFRKTGSFERNGFYNIHTPVLNTKLIYWTFFPTVLWGVTQFVWQGMHEEEHDDNYMHRNVIYDKLTHREIPLTRIWQRPG